MFVAALLTLQLSTATGVGVINLQQLVSETDSGKAAAAQMQALAKEKDKTLADQRAAIQALANKPDDARRAQVELQRMQEDAQAQVNALNTRLQQELFRKTLPIIQAVATEEHLGLVLEYRNRTIPWAGNAVDITPAVVQRLNTAEKPKTNP
jgi:Skp family chaperone for outer membrane proteins